MAESFGQIVHRVLIGHQPKEFTARGVRCACSDSPMSSDDYAQHLSERVDGEMSGAGYTVSDRSGNPVPFFFAR